MSAKSKLVLRELRRIAKSNNGVLQPAAVVEAARPKSSPLHSRFEWDNSIAAAEYRLWQARKLITVFVEVIGDQDGPAQRVWVSVSTDQQKEGGGYRSLISVLSDADLRKELLAEAAHDMEHFTEKYSQLKELAGVISAMKKARRN